MNNEHLTISYRLTQNAPQTVIFEIPLCLGVFVAAIWAKELRKIHSLLQNKPNLQKSQMNVNKVLAGDYENARLTYTPKTNPIQTQSNPISSLSWGCQLTYLRRRLIRTSETWCKIAELVLIRK